MATMLDNRKVLHERVSYLNIKTTRESGLLIKARENLTEVIPPHIHTHVTYQPTHDRSSMIYDVQVQCY